MIKVTGNRILVSEVDLDEKEEITESGLVVIKAQSSPMIVKGKIVSRGDGMDEEKKPEKSLPVGTEILFKKYGSDQIEHEGENYLIVDVINIMAICSKE